MEYRENEIIEKTNKKDRNLEDTILFNLPAKKAYIQMLRLSISSLANYYGFDFESVEDLKLSISEAFNTYVDKCNEIFVQISLKDSFIIEVGPKDLLVNTSNKEVNQESLNHEAKENNIGDFEAEIRRQILSTLMDRVEFKENSLLLEKKKN